ncbi:MAG: DUF5711 family protein [Clostridia bacterium]|nr:DUF5711 family protein [Clostridia bacterium]
MSKDKKKKGLFLFAFILITALCASIQICGGSDFFSNYISNFKRNTQSLMEKFNISIPDSWQKNLPVATLSAKDEDAEQTETPIKESASESKTAEKETDKNQAEQSSFVASHIVALDNADSAQYARYKEYLVCASQTELMAFDKNGQKLWTVAAQAVTPILKTAGKYILLAEKGGTKISVFKGDKEIYSVETQNEIISASISSNCDVVVVTKKSGYKGSVVVYNRDGKEVFVWNSGNSDILDASISALSRRVAVALLDTDNGIKGSVAFFDITKTESCAKQEFDDAIVFDAEFLGETLNAVCDNKIIGLSSKGKLSWSRDYEGKLLSKYGLDTSGLKALMFDDSAAAEVVLFDSRGKQKFGLRSEEIPDFVDIYAGHIAYNNGRELLFVNLTGRDIRKYKIDKDMKNAIILGENSIAVVYQSGLEFFRL